MVECPDRFEFIFSLIYRSANDKELRSSSYFAELLTELSDFLLLFVGTVLKQNSQELLIRLTLFLSLLFLSGDNSLTTLTPNDDLMSVEDSGSEQRRTTTTASNPKRQKNQADKLNARKLLKYVTELLRSFPWGCSDYPLMHLLVSALLPHLDLPVAQQVLMEVFVHLLEGSKKQSDFQESIEQRIAFQTRLVEWALGSESSSLVLSQILVQCRQGTDIHVLKRLNPKDLNQFITELTNTYLMSSNTKMGMLTQKAGRIFTSNITHNLPTLFKQESLFHTLLGLLENTNYYIRNTSLLSLCNLLLSNQLSDHIGRQVITLLLQRHLDQHAHSRSCILGVYEQLIEKKNTLIRKPIVMEEVLEIAVQRLQDKSPFVRKSSLSLIQSLISYFFNLYKVQKNDEERFLTLAQTEKKLTISSTQKEGIINECGELERRLSGDEINLKIELDQDMDELQIRFSSLKDSLENILEVEKLLLKYLRFYQIIKEAIEKIKRLINSKYTQDVYESVEVFILLHSTSFEDSNNLIKYIMVLIFSTESNIKEFILEKFNSILFKQTSWKTEQVATNISKLISSCDQMESTCLEEIFINLQKSINKGQLDQLVKYYFGIWNKSIETPPPQDLYVQIKALRLLLHERPKLVHDHHQNLSQFLCIYDQRPDVVDFLVLKEVILMIRSVMASSSDKKNQSTYINSLLIVLSILTKTHGCDKMEWIIACDSVVTLIFQYHQDPEIISEQFMNKLTQFILVMRRNSLLKSVKDVYYLYLLIVQRERDKQFLCDVQVPEQLEFSTSCLYDQTNTTAQREPLQIEFESKFAQTLFCVSDICLKLLIYADEVKQKLVVIKLKVQQKQNKELDRKKNQNQSMDMDELDQIQGGFEREFEEKYSRIDQIIEQIITSNNKPGYFASICTSICKDIFFNCGEQQQVSQLQLYLQQRNKNLDQVAVLALQKFMCFNHQYALDNLNLLFNLLESKQISNKIKNNIIVGLADICFRFPLDLEPYLPRLINCLSDRDSSIKRTSLVIITHLILMDLLKTKQNISRIAKMLNDPDEKIQQQVKVFFMELNKKDQKSWQMILPDLISQMAMDSQITDEDFVKFSSEIIPYIEKEKVTEDLIEKFIERFMLYSQEAESRRNQLINREKKGEEEIMEFNPIHLTGERECRFLSICLLNFSYNLNSLRKLIQGYDFYRQFLRIDFIYQKFNLILQKCRKHSTAMKANDSKKKKKQSKSIIEGQEMSANQEYNFLIQMLDENLRMFDKNYHLGKNLKESGSGKASRQKNSRATQKQNKQTRKIQRFSDDLEYDSESQSYQIDYSHVNKPPQTRKQTKGIVTQETHYQEQDSEHTQTQARGAKSQPIKQLNFPTVEEESSLDIEI